jgi:hypothetical protein
VCRLHGVSVECVVCCSEMRSAQCVKCILRINAGCVKRISTCAMKIFWRKKTRTRRVSLRIICVQVADSIPRPLGVSLELIGAFGLIGILTALNSSAYPDQPSVGCALEIPGPGVVSWRLG